MWDRNRWGCSLRADPPAKADLATGRVRAMRAQARSFSATHSRRSLGLRFNLLARPTPATFGDPARLRAGGGAARDPVLDLVLGPGAAIGPNHAPGRKIIVLDAALEHGP